MVKNKKPDFEQLVNTLRQRLGDPEELHTTSPLSRCDSALEVLLATILTQATADRNAMSAWESFKIAYPRLDQVLISGADELAKVIQSGGLARQKAESICKVLQSINFQFGQLSLVSLNADPDRAWSFLTQLPGVGPKTAACTMLFGLELPSFPVDLHIHRIARRMGWVAIKLDPVKTQVELTKIIPSQLQRDLHILLLNLGRIYCRPHRPRCHDCPANSSCQQIL